MACCIILSLGELIPRGLIFPFAFGMYVLLDGLGWYDSFISFFEASSNQSSVIPSNVSLSDPTTMFPGLFFMVSYAYFSMSGSHIVRKAFTHFPSWSNIILSLIFCVRSLSTLSL